MSFLGLMRKVERKCLLSVLEKMKVQVLALRLKRIKKSWCKRYPDHLCRWTHRYQRRIAAAFPKTEYQRCIVHQVRNTLKYVPDKDRKAFATDLKTIYQAADEKKALAALDRVMEKWTAKYPGIP